MNPERNRPRLSSGVYKLILLQFDTGEVSNTFYFICTTVIRTSEVERATKSRSAMIFFLNVSYFYSFPDKNIKYNHGGCAKYFDASMMMSHCNLTSDICVVTEELRELICNQTQSYGIV